MKLYNTIVRVVDLVWANSPQEAHAALAVEVAGDEFEVLPFEQTDAFVSEPLPEMGWEGE